MKTVELEAIANAKEIIDETIAEIVTATKMTKKRNELVEGAKKLKARIDEMSEHRYTNNWQFTGSVNTVYRLFSVAKKGKTLKAVNYAILASGATCTDLETHIEKRF